MSDRTINFGSDTTDATYQIQDDDPLGGGNFAINDLDAATAILEYDQTNDEWVVSQIDVTTVNGTDVTTSAVTINGNALGIGDSATLNAADVGAVDTSNFPNLQFNGTTVDSTDTINFIPE